MYGAMDGPSAWMMEGTWDARYFFLIPLMWAVMMIGMMLPSAAPTTLLFATVLRKSDAGDAVREPLRAWRVSDPLHRL
jgi:predicted metal-binding membrane protein